MSGMRAAGMPMTQATAEQITAVYACCALLADTIASIPTQLRNGAQVATSDVLPVSPLLRQPYAEISRIDWWRQYVWAMALRGNFYGQIVERDDLEHPVQIKPISNDHAQVQRDPISGALEYRFYGKIVPTDDVVHVRYQSTPGSVVGLNPIEVCGLSFGLAMAQDRYAESYFLNSATPSGVIKVEGDLSPAETRALLRNWLSKHQGINQANLPSILTGGAEFQPITITPEDSQLLGALQFSQSRIAGMVFRCPLHMVGILDRSSSWGRGLEVQERSFLSNTLIGYIGPGVETLTSLHPAGQFVHFDMRERLRGTALERAQTASLNRLSGIWTADDGRATFDQPPLPDGAGAYTTQPINSELLQQALVALAQSQGEPPEGEGEEPEPGESTLTPSGGAPAAGGSRSMSALAAAIRGGNGDSEAALRELLRRVSEPSRR